MKDQICAVVVTHNRSRLLRDCLIALMKQTRPVDCIIVIDNASTDDTRNLLASEFPNIEVVPLQKNIGSAGGFTMGIRWACEQKFDWIWTLDDDTIANSDALEQLIAARSRFAADHRPNLLASKVLWTDGTLHPMNLQKPKLYHPYHQLMAAECGTMSIRFTSFVSMLIHRTCVFRFGLPIADYFLWNDDVEYSAAILRGQLGVVVPASVVTHATDQKYVPARSVGKKFYFEVRNKMWLMRRSDAFSRSEKRIMARSLARRTWDHLVNANFGRQSIAGVIHGMWDGLTSNPRSNERVLPQNIEMPRWVPLNEEVKPTLSIHSAMVTSDRSGRKRQAPIYEAA